MFKYQYCPCCGEPLENTLVDGESRLGCPELECGFIHFDNPIPVVSALISYDDKALIARNSRWPEGMFGLIAGFLEKDETPEEAVIREIEEETGLQTDYIELIGHYTFSEQNQIIFAYHAECSGTIALNEELAEYRLVDYHKLQPWSKGTGPAVRDWLIDNGYLDDDE